MSLKTALIYPRMSDIHNCPPQGVTQLVACLKKEKINISLIDMTFTNWEEFKEKISEINPDIVGISVQSFYFNESIRIAEYIKERNKNTIVIVGGPHPTISPETILEKPYVDIACIGEADYTLPELIKILESKGNLKDCKGIAYKEKNQIIYTERRNFISNIDELPYPDRSSLPMDKYLKIDPLHLLPYPATGIICSRGCIFNCTYCQPTLRKLWGPRHRVRSVENVIEEIKILKRTYKIRGLQFMDDNFSLNRKWVFELCNELEKSELRLSWSAGTRVDLVDEEILKAMKSAGCIQVFFGVESGSERILKDIMNKRITLDDIKKAFYLCKQIGLFTRANIMLGSPTETTADIDKTIHLIEEIKPDFLVMSITNPMFGTRLYDLSKEKDLLNIKDWKDYMTTKFGTLKLTDVSYEYIEDRIRYIKSKMAQRWRSLRHRLSPRCTKARLNRAYSYFLGGHIRTAIKQIYYLPY